MKPRSSTANPAPGFVKHAGHRIELAAAGKRVRARLAGTTLADSTRAIRMREADYDPVYYFPRQDVRLDLMVRTNHASYCPFKGEASYWNLAAGDQAAENAAWSYQTPFDEMIEIKDYVAFYGQYVEAD